MIASGVVRLTRDPEIRHSQGGMAVAKIGAAHNRKAKGESIADFFDIVAFGKTAEILGEHAKKGSQIWISGKLVQNRWEGDDGTKHSRHEIQLDSVEFVGGLPQEGAGRSRSAAAADEPVPPPF